jgi:hypothetical protein
VLITYEELPKTGIFQKYKIKSIEFRGSWTSAPQPKYS